VKAGRPPGSPQIGPRQRREIEPGRPATPEAPARRTGRRDRIGPAAGGQHPGRTAISRGRCTRTSADVDMDQQHRPAVRIRGRNEQGRSRRPRTMCRSGGEQPATPRGCRGKETRPRDDTDLQGRRMSSSDHQPGDLAWAMAAHPPLVTRSRRLPPRSEDQQKGGEEGRVVILPAATAKILASRPLREPPRAAWPDPDARGDTWSHGGFLRGTGRLYSVRLYVTCQCEPGLTGAPLTRALWYGWSHLDAVWRTHVPDAKARRSGAGKLGRGPHQRWKRTSSSLTAEC